MKSLQSQDRRFHQQSMAKWDPINSDLNNSCLTSSNLTCRVIASTERLFNLYPSSSYLQPQSSPLYIDDTTSLGRLLTASGRLPAAGFSYLSLDVVRCLAVGLDWCDLPTSTTSESHLGIEVRCRLYYSLLHLLLIDVLPFQPVQESFFLASFSSRPLFM